MHPFDADCILPFLAVAAGVAPFLKAPIYRLMARHKKDKYGVCECGHEPPVPAPTPAEELPRGV